ncbi:hypothetical protein OIO90_001225 [Microbotryomycetes sp. JL221]|nr:hypothetical protein OIO90_001225 [Microbotryomycetes sp. JL221]
MPTRQAVVVDRTNEFKEAVQQRQPSKHRKPPPHAPHEPDAWTIQAEQIANNLRSFAQFLHSIRRAYLDLNASAAAAAAASSSSSTTNQLDSSSRHLDKSKGLQAWEGVKWLSDRERDEIDFGVKVALRKSVDRVRQLEQLEKVRVTNVARQNPNTKLTRMLRLQVPGEQSLQQLKAVASHRTYVTLHLNNMLAHVSHLQRQQQELRVQRTLERTATLSSSNSSNKGGITSTSGMEELGRKLATKAKRNSKERNQLLVGQVPSIYKPTTTTGGVTANDFTFDDDDNNNIDDMLLDEDNVSKLELTHEQIQQFEAEESDLLQSTRQDLKSLKLAESSLLEIASLQSQLAVHLNQQAELTDKLWQEAVAVTGSVQDGNTQLKKAKERNRESRIVLLIFLLMSSATLLFLDYYS